MNLDWEEHHVEELNLTPMIDCVLLLLMFFMVTMKLGDEKPGTGSLLLSLPGSRLTINQDFLTECLIQIDGAGEIYMDGHRLGIEAVQARLKKLAFERPSAGVRIDSDLSAPYESVAHVVDLCQFVGLANVALGVRPRPQNRSPVR